MKLYFGKSKKQTLPRKNDYFADYADDIVLLVNTLIQAESKLDNLERVAGGIGLHRNADKKEFMGFNQRAEISTQNGRPLKLENEFI